MTNAYDKIYLPDAMGCLAEAFDYVAIACQMDVGSFFDMFMASGYAERFGDGEPGIVSGLSGTELVMKVMTESGLDVDFPEPLVEYYETSQEYWLGWYMAYLQWLSGRSFKDIVRCISIGELAELVPSLVNSDEVWKKKAFDDIIEKMQKPVRLQLARKQCGYSQRQLAERTDVNLRTLQQYEVKSKDINKAAAVTLKALSRELGCKVEDILE